MIEEKSLSHHGMVIKLWNLETILQLLPNSHVVKDHKRLLILPNKSNKLRVISHFIKNRPIILFSFQMLTLFSTTSMKGCAVFEISLQLSFTIGGIHFTANFLFRVFVLNHLYSLSTYSDASVLFQAMSFFCVCFWPLQRASLLLAELICRWTILVTLLFLLCLLPIVTWGFRCLSSHCNFLLLAITNKTET